MLYIYRTGIVELAVSMSKICSTHVQIHPSLSRLQTLHGILVYKIMLILSSRVCLVFSKKYIWCGICFVNSLPPTVAYLDTVLQECHFFFLICLCHSIQFLHQLVC